MNGRIQPIVEQWLGSGARLTAVKPLDGGWINEVLQIEVDREPFRAVLKLKKAADAEADFAPPECSFAGEADALRYLKRHTSLRVPQVYHVLEADPECSHLLLERLPGVNLEQAELTADERWAVERQMAEHLLELHSHHADRYGFVGQRLKARWLDVFEPNIRSNFEEAKAKLDPETAESIPVLLEAMPDVLGSAGRPTLIHGDIWAGNILVDRVLGGPCVSGWVDPGPLYADVEFELAYLAVFGTAGAAFFDRYHMDSPPRPGYEVRRLYYWLNTMLIHAWVFGYRRYVERAGELARELMGKVP